MSRMQAAAGVGQARWAYTPHVASWSKRLTSFAMVIALSGSSALLSACMALCLDTAMAATAHEHRAPEGGAAPASPSAAMSGHSHHGSPTTPSPDDGAERASALSVASVHANCDSCCLDGISAVALRNGESSDAHLLGAALMAVPAAGYLRTIGAGFGAAPHGPPVPLPPVHEAPLVLRV